MDAHIHAMSGMQGLKAETPASAKDATATTESEAKLQEMNEEE